VVLTGEPHELQLGPLADISFGKRAGSGGGRTPGVEKADGAEMIDGGRPSPGKVAAVT
jgi:hypothetical protein